MNIKFIFVKLFLKIFIFVDFLEDLPQRSVKYFVKVGAITLVSAIFIALIAQELNHATLSRVITYVFIPQARFSSSDKPYVSYPIKIKSIEMPPISAKSLLVYDNKNRVVIYQNNADIQLPPASTTKLVTALAALNVYKLDQSLTVPDQCTLIDSQKVGFLAGDVILVSDLIYALLVSSGGDAACTLAHGTENYGYFIGLMNKIAHDLGAQYTNFSNPAGLDDFAYHHYSSASDMLLIAKRALSDPFLSKVVATKEFTIKTQTFEGEIYNTNRLLWEVGGSTGIKTGRTQGAGEVLIYQYKKDGVDLIIIVMGSLDRFSDTKALLFWTLESYRF